MSQRTLYERVERIRGYNYIRNKAGDLLGFWDTLTAVDRAHTALATAMSRAFKLAIANAKDDPDHYDLERLDSALWNLEDYLRHMRGELDREMGVVGLRERIALLRNVDGRTPEEAEAFRRKADELQQRLEGTAS